MLFARARLLGATSSVALSAMTITAHAQTAGGALDLGTLILGELQTRTVQDSPTSAIVETGEELEQRGDVDVYDVVERAPNVSTTFGNKGFVLRGIQTNGAVSNVQLNGTLVSVQVDGVALNNYQSTFFGPYSSWDVDQIEILRGPQSTQQGRNALAGAVIINTRDPIFENEYRFRVEGGSRNTHRVALSYNQVFSDQVAFRFSAESYGEDGWVTSLPLNDDRYDARSYESYRAKLRWKPNDRFDAVLEASYTDSQGGEDYVLAPFFPGARVTLDNADAIEGSKTSIFGLTTNYEISDTWSLETQTNYYDQDYTRFEGNAPPFGFGQSFRDFSSESQTIEQDIQLKFNYDSVRGVVGLFYTDTQDTRPSRITTDLGALNPAFAGFSDFFNEDFNTDVQNFAIYGEADIDITDQVFVTVGARYDFEQFSYRQSLDFGPLINGVGIPDIASRSGSRSFDAFLPKLGATYEFADEQSVSFTVQRGYRAGGSSSNLVETLIPGVNPISDYDPEFSTNYEFAYRGSFQDDTLRVGANVFYTTWEDMQISVPGTPSGTPLDALFNNDTANAAKSEVYGAELSIEGEPSANLSLFGTVGYTQTEFKSFVSGANNFTGNEFPFAPDWTAAFGGEYRFNNGFTLGADVSYKAASFQDNANTYKDDDRWLLNVNGSYPINDSVTAGFYVRNLLDDDYATARFQDGVNPSIVRTGEPRTIGAYLQAEF